MGNQEHQAKYEAYKKLMAAACDKIIAAGEAIRAGNVEAWNILSEQGVKLKELAEQVMELKPQEGKSNKKTRK